MTEYISDVTERDAWCLRTKAKLVEMANGTILWVGFAMKQLENTEPPDVEEVLKILPKGLNAMYERIQLQTKVTKQKQIATLLR